MGFVILRLILLYCLMARCVGVDIHILHTGDVYARMGESICIF